jgi:hypothetical protein
MTNSSPSKSLLLAFILGLVFPGIGLFYSAPWKVALAGSVGALATIKIFGWIPLVGAVIVGIVGLVSALGCVLFANAHNEGRTLGV